eukprot:CAMPEP_0118656538 /NCGR_PEP_ID=MMETSP0785-20121206/13541_1 /TAXON_ID=91992 /ORGANISM="Bolidomonas pacifica, Strain CCMP 1866" /LENGTH=113 /DNA_ID=CAMNT_0006549401 /DNA_START=300 /DNA_END=641 /DNA_ORIENTATION=-
MKWKRRRGIIQYESWDQVIAEVNAVRSDLIVSSIPPVSSSEEEEEESTFKVEGGFMEPSDIPLTKFSIVAPQAPASSNAVALLPMSSVLSWLLSWLLLPVVCNSYKPSIVFRM